MIQYHEQGAQASGNPFTPPYHGSSIKQRSRPMGGAVAGSPVFSRRDHGARGGPSTSANNGRRSDNNHSKGKASIIKATKPLVIPPAPTTKPPLPPMFTSPNDDRHAPGPSAHHIQRPPDSAGSSDVYARLLLPKKQGFPLWHPGPESSLPVEYRRTGVRIGDVGIITDSGDFDFLFNICLPSDDPINKDSVPEDFSPIAPELRHSDIKRALVASPAGSYFLSGSVKATLAPVPGLFDGRYRFECRSPEGAILALPEGALQEDLQALDSFSDYAGRNAVHWYKHALATQGCQNGSLYLVTGYHKVKSWGTASFTGVQASDTFSLNFTGTNANREPDSYAYTWNQSNHAATEQGPPIEYFPGYKDRPQNQTIFIRGFKIMLSATTWNSMSNEISNQSVPEHSRSGSSVVPIDGSGPVRPRPIHHRSSPSTSTGHRKHIPNGATVILKTSTPTTTLHPSDTLNLHLLSEMPGATVAITHDNVWCSLLDDNADTLPGSQYLLERMQLKYERSLKEGIVSLTPKEIKDRTSAGSKLSTLLERPTLSDDGRRSSSSTIPRPGLGFGRQKAKAALAAAEREGQDPDQTFSSDSASIRTTLPETRGIDSLPAVVAYQAKHQGRLIPKLGPWLLLQKLSMVDGRRTRLGVHRITGLESAVRLIRREKENPSSQLRAVERELRALQTLKHPNIVRLLDVVETDKYIAAMLEYTSGGELIDYIISQTYLKDQEAARLFSQLVSGVWYMHQKRVVHRNIKVETLVLDADRNLLITDFDFAHLAENLGDEFLKTSCGAPIYAAPEVVMGEKLYLGGPVDVWACGIVLYGMVAGYLPFDDDPDNPEGENPRLLYEYITKTPVKFPKHVSNLAQDLLKKMLAPDPAERITIEGVMEHQWVTSHAPISARPELQESRPGSYFPTAFGYTLEDLEMRAERKYKTRLQQCLTQLRAPAAPKRLLSEDQCSTRGSIKSRATTVRPHTSAGEKERVMASSPLSGVTAVGIDQAMSETSGPHHRQLDVVKDEASGKRRNTLPGLVQGTGGRRKTERSAAVEVSMEPDATELGARVSEDGQRSPSVHRSSFKWAKKAIKRLKRKE